MFLLFQALSPADKARLREEFMNEFDENRDGRIEMAEVGIELAEVGHRYNFSTAKRQIQFCPLQTKGDRFISE